MSALLLEFAERHFHRFALHVADLLADDGVVHPVDKVVVALLVLKDAEFSVHVILHLVVIAVQMVGRDVEDDGYVCLEVIHILKLEA